MTRNLVCNDLVLLMKYGSISNNAKCLCYSSKVNVPNLVLMVLKYLLNKNANASLSFVFSCVQMLTGHEGKNYFSKYSEMQR